MKTNTKREENLQRLFQKFPEIRMAYIFGSQVKGQTIKGSDLDLVLVVGDVAQVGYQNLYLKISEIFSKHELDLRIVTSKSSPTFLFQILKNGRCIYQKDILERANFEAKVLHEFYDTDHLRRVYDIYLKKSLERKTYGSR